MTEERIGQIIRQIRNEVGDDSTTSSTTSDLGPPIYPEPQRKLVRTVRIFKRTAAVGNSSSKIKPIKAEVAEGSLNHDCNFQFKARLIRFDSLVSSFIGNLGFKREITPGLYYLNEVTGKQAIRMLVLADFTSKRLPLSAKPTLEYNVMGNIMNMSVDPKVYTGELALDEIPKYQYYEVVDQFLPEKDTIRAKMLINTVWTNIYL